MSASTNSGQLIKEFYQGGALLEVTKRSSLIQNQGSLHVPGFFPV